MTKSRRNRKTLTSQRGGFSLPPYDSFDLGDHVGDDPSAAERNRQRLADSLGIDRTRFVYMEQLHTNTVTVVNEPQTEPVPTTDAIVTTAPGLALVMLVADCIPVLLSDDHMDVAAAVYTGRTGVRSGIVRKSVEKMIELDAIPENIHALLGAAASGHNYEVPEPMVDDVDKHLPGAKTRTKQGTVGVDVRAGLMRQLYDLGVRYVNVESSCAIDDEQYFSHRREGKTGRQADIVVLSKQD